VTEDWRGLSEKGAAVRTGAEDLGQEGQGHAASPQAAWPVNSREPAAGRPAGSLLAEPIVGPRKEDPDG